MHQVLPSPGILSPPFQVCSVLDNLPEMLLPVYWETVNYMHVRHGGHREEVENRSSELGEDFVGWIISSCKSLIVSGKGSIWPPYNWRGSGRIGLPHLEPMVILTSEMS